MSTAPDTANTTTRRAIDERAVEAAWRRMAARPQPPWLHAEVARRMADRLPVIRHRPERVLQWWGRLGASQDLLAQAYPQAHQSWVEPTPALHDAAVRALHRPWWSPRRWAAGHRPQVTTPEALAPRAAGLVWSNLLLPLVADPEALLRAWRAALAPDGFLMFSTFGPDTLRELRALHAEAGWGGATVAWVDMHDLGDMLVQAGFADPVMDQERLTLTWADGASLLSELRTLGGNVLPTRHAGLRTPRWQRRLVEALEARRDAQGRIAMTVEVVYGHAFNAPPRARVSERTEVTLEDMRAMTRSSRRPQGAGPGH